MEVRGLSHQPFERCCCFLQMQFQVQNNNDKSQVQEITFMIGFIIVGGAGLYPGTNSKVGVGPMTAGYE